MRLKDKVAIVTGAGSGIGRATATAFAREGALLVLNDIDPKGLDTVWLNWVMPGTVGSSATSLVKIPRAGSLTKRFRRSGVSMSWSTTRASISSRMSPR